MLTFLSDLDTELFYFINVTLANPVTDVMMPFITSNNFLRLLYIAAMLIILWKGSRKLRWLALFSAFALLLSDQLASAVIKPLVDRPRPCHVLTDIRLLVDCGAGKAMPSTHAANAFCQAMLFGWIFPSWRLYLFVFAGLVGLSRVFVGVHYPGDVFAGAVLGVLIAYGVLLLFRAFSARFKLMILEDL